MSDQQRTGLSSLTTTQLVILGAFGLLGACVIGAAAVYAFNQSGLPNVALVSTAAPFNSPLPASTTIRYPTLPPEWTATQIPSATESPTITDTPTPTDTPPPSATVRPSSTTAPPTRTLGHTRTPGPTSPPATQAPAGQQLLYSLSGNGTGDTRQVSFGPGVVEVVWNYAGSPGGGTVSAADENYHNQLLNLLRSSYESDWDYYTGLMDDASRQGDALAYVKAQRARDARTDQYNRDVAGENSRYEAEKAGASQIDNTSFDVWVRRNSTGANLYIDGATGPSHSSEFFDSFGGDDYYFHVEAAGQWTLTIYWEGQ